MHCEIKELLDVGVNGEQPPERHGPVAVFVVATIVSLFVICLPFLSLIKSPSLLLLPLSLLSSDAKDESVVRISPYTFFRIDDDGILE